MFVTFQIAQKINVLLNIYLTSIKTHPGQATITPGRWYTLYIHSELLAHSRSTVKIFSPENLKIRKSKKSDFSNFAIFRKLYCLFCSRTYRKNKKLQTQNLFSEIINIKPVRVQFTSPNYLRGTLGQRKRLRIHGFWRNPADVQKKPLTFR